MQVHADAHRSQKRATDPLELELFFMSYLTWVLGT